MAPAETLHAMKSRHKNELKSLQSSHSSAGNKGIGNKKKWKDDETILLQKHAEEIQQFHKKKNTNSLDDNDNDSTTKLDTTSTSSSSTTPSQSHQHDPPSELKVAEQIASMSFYNPDKLQHQHQHMSKKELKKQRQA